MDFKTFFGSDIVVNIGQPDLEVQMAGYPGADGLTSMDLGTRGQMITVSGRLTANSRSILISDINKLYRDLRKGETRFDYDSQSYDYCQLISFQLAEIAGKTIRINSAGKAVANFTCVLRSLK